MTKKQTKIKLLHKMLINETDSPPCVDKKKNKKI